MILGRTRGVLKAMIHGIVRPGHRAATVRYRDNPHVVIYCVECGAIFYDGDGRILMQRAAAKEQAHVDQP